MVCDTNILKQVGVYTPEDANCVANLLTETSKKNNYLAKAFFGMGYGGRLIFVIENKSDPSNELKALENSQS